MRHESYRRDGKGITMNRAKKRVILIVYIIQFSILFTGLIAFKTGTAVGNTLYVDDGGGAEYTIIQDAVDEAVPGDTIFVYSGTYTENIVINKDLTLTGQNRDTTFIDGDKSGHVIQASEYIEVNISGFTLKDASNGEGFDCIAFSRVYNSIIENNKLINGDVGEGIQMDHCEGMIIRNNIITDNGGAGISLIISKENVIHNNIIQSNQKGIHFSSSSNDNTIYSNTISENTQYGVYIISSINNQFYLNDFKDNSQNAHDPNTNEWNSSNQGNYWDDLNDVD